MARNRESWVVWARRGSQAGFLVLFLYLFLETAYHPINLPGPYPNLFFNLDPLISLTVWLAARTILAGMFGSLLLLVFTMLFGRWFCGWACPLGSLHHVVTSLRSGKIKEKLAAGGYSRLQRAKYYVLAFFLAGALIGTNLVGWLDPFSFLYRSLAVAVFPAVNLGFGRLFGWIYAADPGVGKIRLTSVSEPAYDFLRSHFLAVEQPHFYGSLIIGLLFFAALGLNLFRARFWCRYLCPLGALLGVAGKNPVLRLVTDPAACNDCRLCVADCQGGANPQAGEAWKPAECFYCWNCNSSCPSGAVSFRFEVPGRGRAVMRSALRWVKNFVSPQGDARLDLQRRTLIVSGLAGAGGSLLFGIQPLAGGKSYNPELIRPPGSVGEEDFLARCIRCGECMKVCPTNAIQAAFLEAGLEGMWSPVLKMRMGYCEFECTLCMQVCPSKAIVEAPVAQKQKVKIGLAFIDRNRCLPYALARTCIVCEEHCPTPRKAIWFEEAEVPDGRGGKVAVKQPHIDPDLCIGCGICENKCPVSDRAAVIVTSAGESRNPKNQILLAG